MNFWIRRILLIEIECYIRERGVPDPLGQTLQCQALTSSLPSPVTMSASPPIAVANLDDSPPHSGQHRGAASVPNPPLNANVASQKEIKRYRNTPSKSFQCRGFGDCRMVFSRSEHLARHVRQVIFVCRSRIYSDLQSRFSEQQETYRRKAICLSLRKAVFATRQFASACADCAFGQTRSK